MAALVGPVAQWIERVPAEDEAERSSRSGVTVYFHSRLMGAGRVALSGARRGVVQEAVWAVTSVMWPSMWPPLVPAAAWMAVHVAAQWIATVVPPPSVATSRSLSATPAPASAADERRSRLSVPGKGLSAVPRSAR